MEEGTFRTRDGLRLSCWFHAPLGAKATLVILHGHGEYSGRYEKFTRIFKEENIAIAAFDFRGAGRSEGEEVFVNSLEEYLNDVSDFFDFLSRKHRVKAPVFLLGHSLGGLVAVHWALRYPQKIHALFLSSPCLGLKLGRHLVLLNSLLNRLCPGLIYKNPVYPPYLTHNLDEVENYSRDPLIKRKISVRLLSEMIRYACLLESRKKLDFPFPVYILMAGLEKVVDVDKTKGVFEKIEAPQKKLKCFDGFYHEIFNELEQEKAFTILKDYLRDAMTYTSS